MSRGWSRGVLRAAGTGDGPVVVKLGGSLLARPGWSAAVKSLLDSLPTPRAIVVGGGPLVDGLRAIDAAEPQSADLVHRLAIDCMGITARLVAAALGSPLVDGSAGGAPPTAVLDVPAWLNAEGRCHRLPVGWQVTSDSIAAFVAAECRGGLLLVKSVAPPHDDVATLAAAGWIDPFFPSAARSLPWIGWAAPD